MQDIYFPLKGSRLRDYFFMRPSRLSEELQVTRSRADCVLPVLKRNNFTRTEQAGTPFGLLCCANTVWKRVPKKKDTQTCL